MDNKNVTKPEKKEKKEGIFKKAKGWIAGFGTKHPKISKAGKIAGKVIGAGCIAFTGFACGSRIQDRKQERKSSFTPEAPAEVPFEEPVE